MDPAVVKDEEARLARAAAAGDGGAFATLYERYEKRAFNLAYRIAGSESDAAAATQEAFLGAMREPRGPQDGEPAFDLSLFAATRNACCELMQQRAPAQPSPSESGQDEVRDANLRLPEHQREALALRELEELSYEEVATVMETSPGSVAQLIFHGRINLLDELHGTALATVAPPGCERALPLIAAREDRQLEAGSDDDAWLDAHLAGCERCRLAVETMREAASSYRAWAPIAVVPWLREQTMSRAAARAGAEWNGATATAPAARDRDGEGRSSRRRGAIVAAGLVALLLGGGIAAVLADDAPSPAAGEGAADARPAASAAASKSQSGKRDRRAAPRTETTRETQASAATSAPPPQPETGGAGGSAPSEPAATPAAGHQAVAGVQPPQTIATPNRKPTPKPTSDPQSQPVPAAAPETEAQPPPAPPTEDPLPDHPAKGRGPPAGVPSQGGH
jgi:RNA polymerase sigma-70 factor, ECF subfamily